jgi:hypothetical protein
MTPAERKAALVERMVAAAEKTGTGVTYDAIEAALTVALEEAAREFDGWGDIYGDNAAAAIRALIPEGGA